MLIEDGMSWKTRFTNTILLNNKLWPNDYEVNIVFVPQTDNPAVQNLTYDKYKYLFNKVFQNAIFIKHDKKTYQQLNHYRNDVIDFVSDPYDQLVGVQIFSKLNSIGGEFLKVEALAAGQAEVLIPIEGIAGMLATSDGTDTTFTLRCNAAAAFDSITITANGAAATAGDLLKAFNDAIIANPGGFVSTVVPPLTTAQVPAAGGGGADGKGQGGRTVITTPAAFATFTGVALN